MMFRADNDMTLDKSVPIIVRSSKNDEYIFQFAVNKEEIQDLQSELKRALKLIKEESKRGL